VRPTPESSRKQPVSPYGVAKLAGEYYLWAYAQLHGLEYAALRYSNVYGPRQDPHGEAGVVAIFCGRVARGEALTIYGDGEQTRDYVYVADVARANVLISTAPLAAPGGIDDAAFNVGTGEETSVNDLAARLQRAVGRSVAVQHAPARPGELRNSSLDARKLRGLGWAPSVERSEGLALTYRTLTGSGS
jgi:UDP-glucose 4-epimerase